MKAHSVRQMGQTRSSRDRLPGNASEQDAIQKGVWVVACNSAGCPESPMTFDRGSRSILAERKSIRKAIAVESPTRSSLTKTERFQQKAAPYAALERAERVCARGWFMTALGNNLPL